MPDQLDNGHILTDEDVDTARLIRQLDDRLGRPSDDLTLRIAATPLSQVRPVIGPRPNAARGGSDRTDR